MTTSTAPRKRPGGRSARVRDTVYRAVGTLVIEGHRETMTIPQVADAAGVNATSIYRRWGTIETLLEEVAVAALTRDDDPLPDTGSLAGDLADWAKIIAADIDRPQRRAYLRAMVAARDGVVDACPCWDIRITQAGQMIERAAERGDATPQVRQVLDHVIAPMYHHAVFGLPLDDAYASLLVDDVLAMVPSR